MAWDCNKSLDDIKDDIGNMIHNYSIMLLGGKGDKPPYLGSGTLVRNNRDTFILTARHVADDIRGCDFLGLGLDRNEEESYSFPLTELVVHTSESKLGYFGLELPDIAFIRLPSARLGLIEAIKSVYPLAKGRGILENYDQNWFLSFNPSDFEGVFAYSGWAGYNAPPPIKSQRYEKLYQFPGAVGIAPKFRRYEMPGPYDVICFDPRPQKPTPDIPERFGGYSGGGIWFIPIRKEGDYRAIPLTKITLVGIVLGERINEESKAEELFCHGPLTLYGSNILPDGEN